ncbi:MAG: 3-deoxy-7-phosphoheptulonate synthase, partial [Opitutaceae bacterium]|nr:3-deoxy-7-phosphoheptulonate synthase [Opitutaceae bacterium]
TGNPEGHLVLRGGSRTGPNFNRAAVQTAVALLKKSAAAPVVLIDCSHGNSGKEPAAQITVARDIADQIGNGERAIIGVMLESNLVAGSQKHEPGRALVHGQSITDACLSLQETLPVLEQLAEAVTARRRART